ncbi:MAG: 50S ribosomal protein L5 [Chlamydiia bacterium]|nr:50S ribosomal protein L5 [Chlamydiia bacterium]
MSRLKQYYNDKVRPALQEKFGIANVMNIPKLEKIVINMGIAETAKRDKNAVQDHLNEMAMLSGQKPLLTKSKKAIAGFKLREGQDVGIKVTIRGKRMFDFLDRLCNVVAPRIADFRGFPERCDGRGNYSLGLKSQEIFPEINLDLVKNTQGMHITFVTSAPNDQQCIELLRLLGMPFAKQAVVITLHEGA